MANTGQSPTGNHREPLAFDERTRRVMELRKQVNEGTYHPADEDIAIAMLRDWSGLAAVTRETAPEPVDTNPDASAFAGRFVVSGAAQEQPSSAMMTA